MKLIKDLSPEENRELDDKITMQNLENVLTNVQKHGITEEQFDLLGIILLRGLSRKTIKRF